MIVDGNSDMQEEMKSTRQDRGMGKYVLKSYF